jgi:hypothetical protein
VPDWQPDRGHRLLIAGSSLPDIELLRSDNHLSAWRCRQEREVDIEPDPQRLGDGCEQTDCWIAAPSLQRGDHRLGNPQPLGQLKLRQPDALARSTDPLTYGLRVDRRAAGARHA